METLNKSEKKRLLQHLKNHESDCYVRLYTEEITHLIELLEKEK